MCYLFHKLFCRCVTFFINCILSIRKQPNLIWRYEIRNTDWFLQYHACSLEFSSETIWLEYFYSCRESVSCFYPMRFDDIMCSCNSLCDHWAKCHQCDTCISTTTTVTALCLLHKWLQLFMYLFGDVHRPIWIGSLRQQTCFFWLVVFSDGTLRLKTRPPKNRIAY